ncbi:MAG TPA: NAD-dependent epimerase/dehydratase family protein [Frankiaceae bacterium]|nr:NAD-dependent epimerase/dehydratase family protein [Frankiaceae bacterium]
MGSGTRIVVTGGGGFLGNAFVVAFRRRYPDAQVVALDVRPGPGVTVADVLDEARLTDLFTGADLVVHTAAVVEESGAVDVMWRINVTGTATVLAAAEAAGVPAVLHLSSIVVHGPTFPDGVDETGPVRMSGNPYTDTKVASEHQALLAAARGLPVAIVRPGDVYGPGSSPWTLRPVATIRAGSFRLLDRGRGILSPVYVDDVIEGALSLLEPGVGAGESVPRLRPEATGQVFHVTGGVGVPAAEFFGHYARMTGVRLKSVPGWMLRVLAPVLERLPLPFSPRIVEYLSHPGTYSIDKITRTTGWTPRVDLLDGMERTEQWLRDRALLPRPESPPE